MGKLPCGLNTRSHQPVAFLTLCQTLEPYASVTLNQNSSRVSTILIVQFNVQLRNMVCY